jgi:hypothetical protein
MNNKYILLLLCLSSFFSFTSCDDIVNYNDGYTPAEQQYNSGAPVIKAVYDVADTAFTTPITQGTLGQTVVLVGENLNQVQAVSFNTVACDIKNVYTMATRAIVQIPSKLSTEQVNKIEYSTPQGTCNYDFLIPFPDLIISGLACEFTNAGDSATVYGKNFDLYNFEGGVSAVKIGSQTLGVGSVTAESMKFLIPEGTPENTNIHFSWQTNGVSHEADLTFRPSQHLLFGDFSGVSMSKDGTLQMAIEGDDGIGASAWLNQKNMHFTGHYGAWAWNTLDLSCNMTDVAVDNPDDYVLKMEVLTNANFPLTEQTGLQFCFNWGDSFAWNPANGLGINTRGQWQTVSLPLAPMATKGISEPGKWQTLRIIFQPHADYDADFRLANLRIVKK